MRRQQPSFLQYRNPKVVCRSQLCPLGLFSKHRNCVHDVMLREPATVSFRTTQDHSLTAHGSNNAIMRCKVVSRRQLGPFGSVSLIRTFDALIPVMRPVDRTWRGAASPGGCQKVAGRGAKQFLKVSWRKLRPCLFSLFPGSAGFLSRRDNWGLLRFFLPSEMRVTRVSHSS